MSKSLVAYFSASGITKKVAVRLAASIGADVFEIKPQKPYTDADLRWTNPLARCNREKIGRKDVPIDDTISNIAKYDTMYLGFPIWYYAAPNIIQTFLKQYDMSNMRIALFATSGGSDIGKTKDKLKLYLSPGAKIIGARLFNPNTAEDELKSWANSLI